MEPRDKQGKFIKRGRKICTIEGCGSFVYGHGLCSKHSQRVKAHGDPYYKVKRLTPEEKILKRRQARNKYNNSEKGKKRNKEYQATEVAKHHRAKGVKDRRARVKLATPSWVNKAEINKFYRDVPVGMVVDHIFPLVLKDDNGEHIGCGLHVIWNLQYITAEENRKKWNKLEDE